MKAAVDLGAVAVRPEASIRILGLHIDSKLRWGPHISRVKSKMVTQRLALSVIAGSTWGATLNKARQVYPLPCHRMASAKISLARVGLTLVTSSFCGGMVGCKMGNFYRYTIYQQHHMNVYTNHKRCVA